MTVRHSLLALGYAGWGPGQLDDEIQRNGWLCVPADDALVFGASYWAELVEQQLPVSAAPATS